MAERCGRCGVVVWAYCLMPNHVHLIVVPESEDGLRRGIGEAHRRHRRRINFHEGRREYLTGRILPDRANFKRATYDIDWMKRIL